MSPQILDPSKKLLWLRACVVMGLAAGILLSPKLWLSSRFYPLTPVWQFLKSPGHPLDSVFFGVLLVLLVAAVAAPKSNKVVAALVLVAVALALMDESRWQPWFYQYLFMLIALVLIPWRQAGTEGRNAALDTCRLIVAGVYFWSGLQKLNPQFIDRVFPWLMEPVTKFLPLPIGKLGIAAAVIEVGISVALLTKRFRNAGVVAALAMHLIILLAIGPLGHNHNAVVWPWNVAMSAFVAILFWETRDSSFRNILWTERCPFQKVALVLFGIAPLLSFFNLWDHYLSSAMYSGNRNIATIYLAGSVSERLPDAVQEYLYEADGGSKIDSLPLAEWSLGELHVPPYPEMRVFKTVARWICSHANQPSDVSLVVQKKATLVRSAGESTANCSSLLE